jgi:Matrixin
VVVLGSAAAVAAEPGSGAVGRLGGARNLATRQMITLSGIRVAVPRPGFSVGASALGADGRTTELLVSTDATGHVSTSTDLPTASGAASPQAATAAALAACSDSKYKRTGTYWHSPFHWSFRAASTPTGLKQADVEATLKHAVGNITHERNDCGRSDNVSAQAFYDGRTTLGTHIGGDDSCRRTDGHDVIAFGRLPSGTLAFTCWWYTGNTTIEADTVINSAVYSFALTLGTCSNDYMLESVATHEMGHVFGLGHVMDPKHANLTMSPKINICQNSDATLGLGDMLGLESLY